MPNLPKQTWQTKSTKSNLSNQNYQMQSSKTNEFKLALSLAQLSPSLSLLLSEGQGSDKVGEELNNMKSIYERVPPSWQSVKK